MPTTNEIIALVADRMNVTREQILGRNRCRQYVRPRQIAMTLCREFTRLSLPQIGRKFDKDHTTVLFAIRAVSNLEQYYPRTADFMDEMRQRLKGTWQDEPVISPSREEVLRSSWKGSASLTVVPGGI